MSTKYDEILSGMSAISLEQMDSVKLMSRIDTKYLTDGRTVSSILERAASMGYYVFENCGARVQEYSSLYYDTDELQMYMDHHNRRMVRQKLRTRSYHSSGVTFLELKSKNNHGRTKKKRVEIDPSMYCRSALDDNTLLRWLEGKLMYSSDTLTPSLETRFTRITLVNPEMTERATIDCKLSFRNLRTDLDSRMGTISVIEVKQDGNLSSPLREMLLDLRVKPMRISKYCIGIALTSPEVKSGRFKNKVMLIDKIREKYD